MEMLVGDSPAADKEHKGAGSYAQGDQPSAFLLQGIAEEAGQGRSDTTHGPRSDSLEPVCGSTGLGTCSVHGDKQQREREAENQPRAGISIHRFSEIFSSVELPLFIDIFRLISRYSGPFARTNV